MRAQDKATRLAPLQPRKARGISTAEALIALMICAFAIGAGFLINSQELAIVKAARETTGASAVLEERIEQLRAATWKQVTDPTYLAESYFSVQPKSIAAIPNSWEQIRVSAWPASTTAPAVVVEKRPKSEAAVLQRSSELTNERLAKIDVRIFWVGKNGRTRMRDVTTIISNGGISRMNLPGLGGGGGTTDPPQASPTPTATPTATPANNGNGGGGSGSVGHGRGNVGGKPGKD